MSVSVCVGSISEVVLAQLKNFALQGEECWQGKRKKNEEKILIELVLQVFCSSVFNFFHFWAGGKCSKSYFFTVFQDS